MTNGAKAFLIALLALLICAGAPGSSAQTNALAIFNFRAANIEAMGYNGEILYALISRLESEKSIELMSRRIMEEKLARNGMAQGDNPDLVLKAGQLLGISYILFGTVTKKDSSIHARLQLMDIAKGQVIKTWLPVFAGHAEILDQTAAIAADLAKSVGSVSGPDKPPAKPRLHQPTLSRICAWPAKAKPSLSLGNSILQHRLPFFTSIVLKGKTVRSSLSERATPTAMKITIL
jgi:TolB-like protein